MIIELYTVAVGDANWTRRTGGNRTEFSRQETRCSNGILWRVNTRVRIGQTKGSADWVNYVSRISSKINPIYLGNTITIIY